MSIEMIIDQVWLSDWDLADLEATLAARVWQDEAFRVRLLADAKATIEEETGLRLPAGLRLSIHLETPLHRHLVIPAAPAPDE